MNMGKLTIEHSFSLVESVKFQLKLIIPQITDRQTSILAYMIVYPTDFREKIVKDDVAASKESLAVRLFQMEDLGVLRKNDKGERVIIKDILDSIQLTDFVYEMKIKINK